MPRRWVTIRAMSTAALPIRSMEEMTWSTDAMASASLGCRAASTDTARMSWTRSDIWSSSVVDLLGHVGVAEVERGVGKVDHQLREVLRFGEHGPEVPGSGIHRVPRRIRRAHRGCRRRCDGLVHTVAVRRRRPRPRHRRPAGPGGGRLLGDRRPHAPARRPVSPSSTTSSVPSIQPPTGDLGVFTLRSTGVRRWRGDPRRAHLHGRVRLAGAVVDRHTRRRHLARSRRARPRTRAASSTGW